MLLDDFKNRQISGREGACDCIQIIPREIADAVHLKIAPSAHVRASTWRACPHHSFFRTARVHLHCVAIVNERLKMNSDQKNCRGCPSRNRRPFVTRSNVDFRVDDPADPAPPSRKSVEITSLLRIAPSPTRSAISSPGYVLRIGKLKETRGID